MRPCFLASSGFPARHFAGKHVCCPARHILPRVCCPEPQILPPVCIRLPVCCPAFLLHRHSVVHHLACIGRALQRVTERELYHFWPTHRRALATPLRDSPSDVRTTSNLHCPWCPAHVGAAAVLTGAMERNSYLRQQGSLKGRVGRYKSPETVGVRRRYQNKVVENRDTKCLRLPDDCRRHTSKRPPRDMVMQLAR